MKNERFPINQKRQKKKRKIFYLFKLASFLFLFKSIFADLMAKNNIRKLNDNFSEIKLVVQGSGEKQILYSLLNDGNDFRSNRSNNA